MLRARLVARAHPRARAGSARLGSFLWLGLAVGAVALVGCDGCGRKPAPATAEDGATLTHVKVQLNWVPEPEFGGLYAARAEGDYAKRGIEAEIVGGGPGSPVVQLVASGRADFAIAGADDVVTARSHGVDVVAVFGTFQTSPQGIMVHAARGIASLADLKSGTLALEPGLPFGMYLKKKFGFAGVTLVPYDGGIAKFLSDPSYAQQCYVTSEPLAVKKKGESPKIFLGADAGYNPYANIVITRGALLKDNPLLVQRFVAATADGWRAYLKDPRPANAVMQKLNAAMDAETFAAAAEAERPLIETDETAQHGLGFMTESRWQTLAEELAGLGVVDRAPAASACFRSPTKP